ncbi:MAG: hypothetical protein AAGF54_12985, partial [Pseudomonadota bacterium]
GEAISMSFGFDRLASPPRCERLENAPHFLRFRALMRRKPPQTLSASFMDPSPMLVWKEANSGVLPSLNEK